MLTRPKTFDEKTEALSPQDKQTLEQNIASYTVFPMVGLPNLHDNPPPWLATRIWKRQQQQRGTFKGVALSVLQAGFCAETHTVASPARACVYMLLPVQDELELLVSSTVDGQLVLSDCFCLDTQVCSNCLHDRAPHAQRRPAQAVLTRLICALNVCISQLASQHGVQRLILCPAGTPASVRVRS